MKEPKKPVNENLSFSHSAGSERSRSTGGQLSAAAVVRRVAPSLISTADDFSALFESSSEALLLADSSGTIDRANACARRLLHLRQTDPRGINLGTLLAERSGAEALALFDSARPTMRRSIDADLATGHPVRITLRSVLPSSHSLLLCLEEGSVVHRAESKWRQADAELRSVLDSVPTGVILFNARGGVHSCNARFGQLFGMGSRELERLENAQDLGEVLAQRFRNPECFSAHWKSFMQGEGEPAHDELEVLRPARRVIERFSRPVLDREGHPTGWLELYSDVTGERQIQSKMLQTEKMAAVGQLVSGIAHELNNPLTAIMGYAQLLLGHGLKPGQLSEARKVYHEAERARRIVKNLLYFARESKPERSRVDVNEIIERTLALRGYELKLENIAVFCDLEQDLPRTMADPYQLQQVVLNLVINAEQAIVEARGQGHIWIRTHHARRHDLDRISIEIADDGPGIPTDISYRIFDPFFTTKPPGVGTGLGLSIVYGIVHQHAGEVTFSNQPGMGAKFTVELPVVPVPAAHFSVVLSKPAGAAQKGPRGRILAIEDERTVAELIVDVLRDEGHQVEAVLDSKQGLERLARDSYDLVICDLRMPGLDGPAFYDALVRAGSPLQNRILFITGDTLARRTTEFLEPRKLPYLAKPFLVEELKLAVNQLLATAEKELVTAGPANRGR